jgi:hypothetical protein
MLWSSITDLQNETFYKLQQNHTDKVACFQQWQDTSCEDIRQKKSCTC